MFDRLVAVVIFLLLGTSSMDGGEPSSSCSDRMQRVQIQMLGDLKVMEESFRDRFWLEWKHRNLLYHDLWKSDLKRRDKYSAGEQAEGQLLYERLLHDADFIVSEISIKRHALNAAWISLKSFAQEISKACPFQRFQDCSFRFREDFEKKLSEMEKVLSQYDEHSHTFHTQVLQSLKDTPSDHGSFSERFYEKLIYFATYTFPEFQTQWREIRHSVEYDWPISCCDQCAPDRSTGEKDVLLDRLKIKGTDETALSEREMNKTDLVKAFKDSEQKSG